MKSEVPKGYQFEKKANRLQFACWNTVLVLSSLALACSAFTYLQLFSGFIKDTATVVCRIAQLLQVTDLFAKGNPTGKIIHIFGRNLIAWAVLPLTPNETLAELLMLIWSIGDIIRYNYYLKGGRFAGQLRYNVFIINYPTGLILEFLNIYSSYVGGQLNYKWVTPWTLLALGAIMVAGFKISFTQLYGQRKVFYAKETKK